MTDTAEPRRVLVWGVPIAPITLEEAVERVTRLIAARRPSFFITANTHYAMLCETLTDLRAINDRAAFIVADGAPLVWASRLSGSRLPERVAGSDLIFHLCEEAAREGHRVYFLGGGEGVAAEAAQRLVGRYPDLQVVGTACPPYRELSADEHAALIDGVRAANPDLLIVAFTMPKGERWLSANLDALGVPVVVNVGAAFDFAAERIRRAPRWMQKTGLEWAFRLGMEPRRLFGRYSRNALFIARMLRHDLRRSIGRRRTVPASPSRHPDTPSPTSSRES